MDHTSGALALLRRLSIECRACGFAARIDAGYGGADVDDEEKIARGVARGIARHEAARADAQARQLLGCLLLFAIFGVGFILLVTYGN
jgi:hypothetical protein